MNGVSRPNLVHFCAGVWAVGGTFYYLLIILSGVCAALIIVFTKTFRAGLPSSWSDSLVPIFILIVTVMEFRIAASATAPE